MWRPCSASYQSSPSGTLLSGFKAFCHVPRLTRLLTPLTLPSSIATWHIECMVLGREKSATGGLVLAGFNDGAIWGVFVLNAPYCDTKLKLPPRPLLAVMVWSRVFE